MSEDIDRASEIGPSASSRPPSDAIPTPEAIGGWLILPAIGLVVVGALSVIGILASLGMASNLPDRYQGIFALNLLGDAGLTVFLIYAATRFFGKRRNAPAVMIAFLVAQVVANALLLLINLGADAEPFAVACAKATVQGVVGAAIWIPYFAVSKRVKRTFVIP